MLIEDGRQSPAMLYGLLADPGINGKGCGGKIHACLPCLTEIIGSLRHAAGSVVELILI
jgi:hypothetical protein